MNKLLVLATILVLMVVGCMKADMSENGFCPDRDVWARVWHHDEFSEHHSFIVFVYIPKHSLKCEDFNCPSADTKVVGEGVLNGKSTGYHLVILGKGFLNNRDNYRFSPPKLPKCFPDNFSIWTANNEKNVFASVD